MDYHSTSESPWSEFERRAIVRQRVSGVAYSVENARDVPMRLCNNNCAEQTKIEMAPNDSTRAGLSHHRVIRVKANRFVGVFKCVFVLAAPCICCAQVLM
jgi:hypothetical protein